MKQLEKHPEEVQALFRDILIHVTNFFREPESFAALAAQVFPELLKNRNPDDPIRVWVPGCSTGEEAYSLAICLVEFLGERPDSTPIQIFGTDVSEPVIEAARRGIFDTGIEARRLAGAVAALFHEGRSRLPDQQKHARPLRLRAAERGEGSALLEARPHQLPQCADLLRAGAAKETHPASSTTR